MGSYDQKKAVKKIGNRSSNQTSDLYCKSITKLSVQCTLLRVRSLHSQPIKGANGYVRLGASINMCWPALAHSLGYFDH